MGVISILKGWWNKLFTKTIKDTFKTDMQLSDTMKEAISKFYQITEGTPPWNDKNDDIESINFAGYINDVTAGLVTLDLGIELPESNRGKYLQGQADYILSVINDKVSEGLGNCGIMLKPNGENVDYIEPGNFAPTETDSNGNILGCVFQSQLIKDDMLYTRLEYHRFEEHNNEKIYRITNYAYKTGKKSASADDPGRRISLKSVPEWTKLQEDTVIRNIEKPLFAYFKNPAPNKIDRHSPLGVPIWANCIKELKDLDIAWSRKAGEVQDSKHMTFMPEEAVKETKANGVTMARFVKGVPMGINVDSTPIHEHVATLLTSQRIEDINSILSMISTKCGFSQGFFVLDRKTGMITATQVESDDRATIGTIKNIRDNLKTSIEQLLYALNIMADIYSNVPAEKWEGIKDKITWNFGDITYSYQEDKATWWQYVSQGKMPAYLYFVKFEGMTEDEAKAYVAEAQPNEKMLFGAE